MTDWQKVYGSQSEMPQEFDSTSSKFYVYQRRNVKSNGEGWVYDERKMSHAEYADYRVKTLEAENTQLQLALADLYENLLEG